MNQILSPVNTASFMDKIPLHLEYRITKCELLTSKLLSAEMNVSVYVVAYLWNLISC
jgi:hypothetical protein